MFNCHNDDNSLAARDGFGVDIATQRADDLDLRALAGVTADSRALDIGCGRGGQTVRMALAGARVVAADLLDYAAEVCSAAVQAGVGGRVTFRRCDLRIPESVRLLGQSGPFDLVVCQRAIHYLHYADAVRALQAIATLLSPGGALFLSASGLDSELGRGYPDNACAVEKRYAPLTAAVAQKHRIQGAVCLYREADLEGLVIRAGFVVEEIFRSPFGNIKAIARRRAADE